MTDRPLSVSVNVHCDADTTIEARGHGDCHWIALTGRGYPSVNMHLTDAAIGVLREALDALKTRQMKEAA